MLEAIANHASDIASIIALTSVLIKPLRERVFGDAKVKEGYKCLLRSEIIRTYYRHLESKEMHQYEYENLGYCYKAYKELGGNSFVDHIYTEMQEWTVIR